MEWELQGQEEAQRVFYYFEEISRIPRGSGNTKQISDYCVAFAKEHGLKVKQDQAGNVIICKDGSKGRKQDEPVILQGHLDMVCEKDPDYSIDFTKDGLDLYTEGDFLQARGTTLGADDGIAIAYALAILENQEISHPPIEAVFTVDEEIGLLGAAALDCSVLRGRQMINIDMDVEGSFIVGCAGGRRIDCRIPVSYEEDHGEAYSLTIGGLKGGHSGSEIDEERGNAIALSGRVLKAIADEVTISLISLEGGQMDNAIPRSVTARVLVPTEEKDAFCQAVSKQEACLRREYRDTDSNLKITVLAEGERREKVLSLSSMVKVLFFLREMPYGVISRSKKMPGLVETSLNPGIMRLTDETDDDGPVFSVAFSVRSSVSSRKEELTERLSFLTEFLGGEASISGDYPGWDCKLQSEVQQKMCACYRALTGKEPQVMAIHAGLECGIFSDRLQGLDCISLGPDCFDIHTTKERLSISSAVRCYRLLLAFLAERDA